MKTGVTKILFTLTICAFLVSFDMPKGWRAAGTDANKYEMGVATGEGKDGKNCATIRSVASKISGFGSMMQYIVPGKYAGKRVKMSAWIRSKDVKGWAGVWMRVDREINVKYSAFDNMAKRPVKGTTEWTKYEITLDVAELSAGIGYGVLLAGTGQIWFDDVQFEILDKDKHDMNKIITQPENLSFED